MFRLIFKYLKMSCHSEKKCCKHLKVTCYPELDTQSFILYTPTSQRVEKGLVDLMEFRT